MADVVSGDRPLTPEGTAALERLGRRLRERAWKPERAFASPLLRARASARIVLDQAGLSLPVGTIAELDPALGTPETVLVALAEAGAAGHVLLVGHQPLLGQLAFAVSRIEIPFAPAALAMFECVPGAGPGRCRRIGLLSPGSDF